MLSNPNDKREKKDYLTSRTNLIVCMSVISRSSGAYLFQKDILRSFSNFGTLTNYIFFINFRLIFALTISNSERNIV